MIIMQIINNNKKINLKISTKLFLLKLLTLFAGHEYYGNSFIQEKFIQ